MLSIFERDMSQNYLMHHIIKFVLDILQIATTRLEILRLNILCFISLRDNFMRGSLMAFLTTDRYVGFLS